LILHVEQFHRTFRLVAFNMGEHLDELLQLYQTKTPIDVAFRPILNSFNGQMKVDFHLVDWRKHI
ncbi:MAG: hypothetical protein ACI4UF_05380, partial [Thermoguttaceae bacterium]